MTNEGEVNTLVGTAAVMRFQTFLNLLDASMVGSVVVVLHLRPCDCRPHLGCGTRSLFPRYVPVAGVGCLSS
jgi:hypothetical protein